MTDRKDLKDLTDLTDKLGTDTSEDRNVVADVLADLHERLSALEYKFEHKDDVADKAARVQKDVTL
jgi:hypothetical protein